MTISLGLSAKSLLDDTDEVVFDAGRDASRLPTVESKLGEVLQLLQACVKPDQKAGRELIAGEIARIKQTLWNANLLINYYDKLSALQSFDIQGPPINVGSLPEVAAEDHPAIPTGTAAGASVFASGPDTISSRARSSNAGLDRGISNNASSNSPNVAPALDVADVGPTESALKVQRLPSADTREPVLDLDGLDRSALLEALRLGPTTDRRSYYTAVPRNKPASVHRLLSQRFNVDGAATQSVLNELITAGLVSIQLRGLPPTGRIAPCIVVV